MKTILILNYEYPPLGGGAGVVSQKYAHGLSALGNKVVVVTTWFKGEKEVEEIGNLKIIKLKSIRKKIFQSNPIEMLSWAFTTIRFLNNYLKENKIDFCIAFFSIPGGIVANYLKEKFNISYIISTHGADIPGFYPQKMKKFHIITNWYAKKIWSNADNILVLTTEMKKLADAFSNPSKNVILPNGCYSNFFYPDLTKRKKILHILFVGRFCEEKDIFILLQGIQKLKNQTNDFVLNLIGDGPLRKKIEKYLIDNELHGYVNITGWISKEQLREYYQMSHIQVCSSKVEAMSIAMLESIYSGLYILSTPISGNTDMIQERVNGEFFDIGDYEGLGEKLIYWSKKYNELKIDKKLITDLKKQYDWNTIIYNLNQLINE